MHSENQHHRKINTSFNNTIGELLKTSNTAKIIEIVVVFGIAFLIIEMFKSEDPLDIIYNQTIVWVANIIMLAMVYAGLKLRGEPLIHFGISFKRFSWKQGFKTFLQSVVVFVLALTGFVLGAIIMANITGIPEDPDMSGYNYLKNNLWMLFVSLGGVYMVSSFGEEIIYRAFLINRISEIGSNHKKNKTIAIIMSAIFFGLVHYSWGIMGIVQTGFMGLVLGVCYIYLRKRIWVLIFAHAYMDTILMLQMYFG